MSIQHCFSSGAVVADITSTDKYEAIHELIEKAPVFRTIQDKDAFREAVLVRERLQSTGLGHGVAVAHGRTPGIDRVLIGLGLSRAGIAFDSPDGEPVQLLFIIASPPSLSLDYLQALSTLVRCVRHQSLRDSLFSARTIDVVEARIREAFAGAVVREAGSRSIPDGTATEAAAPRRTNC